MKQTAKQKILAIFLCMVLLLTAAACGAEQGESSAAAQETPSAAESQPAETAAAESGTAADAKAPVIQGLTYESTTKLDYAKCFQIFRYEGGYSVIRVDDGRNYLLVPEGGTVPEGLPSDVVVIYKPVSDIYIAATAAMALFDSVDALDTISMSSVAAENWYVENAVAAMESGEIIYAGKYSAPDYELLVNNSCDLAIESTMIWHSPDILEKIEELGIPVLIDRASYETNPLGRTEWVKLYGELVDKQQEAADFFAVQESYVDELSGLANTGKTVAVFYVSSTDTVVVRKSSDYVSKMIEIAGGKYIFENLGAGDEGATATVDMTMEEFYASAMSADYMIYNASISDPVTSIDDLLAKNELFANFKAVKEGHVWCTQRSLYQATDAVGTIIMDFHEMINDPDTDTLNFIYRLS